MARKPAFEANGVAHLYELRQKAGDMTPPVDPAFQEKYPNLFSMLACNRIAEDKAIEPVALRINVSAGDWAISLSCGALNAFGGILASTVELGLAEVEQKLAAGRFPWTFNQKREPKIRTLKEKK